MIAIAVPASAGKAADNGLNEKGEMEHLYLFEKNPTDWTIVPDGAWGKLSYLKSKFVFNGHELEPETSYTLIYYPDPWNGAEGYSFGSAIADEYGDVHIAGEFTLTHSPSDLNTAGSKIWLVLTSDWNNGMTAWNPTEYLFEYELIPVQTP